MWSSSRGFDSKIVLLWIYYRGSFHALREVTVGLLTLEAKIESSKQTFHFIIQMSQQKLQLLREICLLSLLTELHSPAPYSPLFFHPDYFIVVQFFEKKLLTLWGLVQMENKHCTANHWCQIPPLAPCSFLYSMCVWVSKERGLLEIDQTTYHVSSISTSLMVLFS